MGDVEAADPVEDQEAVPVGDRQAVPVPKRQAAPVRAVAPVGDAAGVKRDAAAVKRDAAAVARRRMPIHLPMAAAPKP